MKRTEASKRLILSRIRTMIDECWGDAVSAHVSEDIDSYDDPSCDRVDFMYFDLPTKGLQPSIGVVIDAVKRTSNSIDGWHIVVHFNGSRCWIGVEQDRPN